MNFFKKKRYKALILFMLLLIVIKSRVTLRKTDAEILKTFKVLNQTPKIFHDTFNKQSIRWIVIRDFNPNLPTVIFVHGAPGSLNDYDKYLQDNELQDKANLIAIDRLGYGYSDFGKATVSIEQQAEMIEFIAKKYSQTKTILVGWSYGGAIVGKMVMSNPTYKHVIMIAPAISAKDEKYFWFGNFAKWKITRWLSPKVFQVAEDEKLAHAKELEKLDKEWQHITTPITYYHGNKDRLVPYENKFFLQRKMNDSLLKFITIQNGSHFIMYKNYDLIKRELISIVNQL